MLRTPKFLLLALIVNYFTTLTPTHAYAHGSDLPESPASCMQKDGYYDCNLCTCPLIPGYLIAIFVVYALSLIISIIPIVGFLISSKLREAPGDFFFILSLAGGIGSITMLWEGTYDVYTNLGTDGSEDSCIGFATSSDFTKRVTRCYNVAFMIYFMIGLRFTLKQSKIPKILYHAIPLIVSAALTIQLAAKSALGKAIDGTCGTKSSTDSSGYIAEVVLCCIMVLVFLYMLKYLSGHRTRLEDNAKKQLRYYLRYFIIANLVLLFTCVQSLVESIGMENYITGGGPLNYTNAREVLIARQSGIIKDLISAIGITAVRVFDPFLRDSWREIFATIFRISLAKRSRASTMTSSLNDDLIDEDNKNRRMSPTAQEVSEAMKKRTALVQLQHHRKVQTTYSLLAAIHYYYNNLASKIQGGQVADSKFPGVNLTKERVNEKHVYPINKTILEENLPEIVEEIKTKSYDIVKGKLTVYAPTIFAEIAQLDCVTNKLLASLELNKNDSRILKSGIGEGGRGGEFFFFSTDNKFIIKTINNTEMKVLLEILPRYTQHFKDHPNSLISKIYGAFTFTVKSPSESFHFIMMRNVNGYPSYCTERKYDLKGSTVDRTAVPAGAEVSLENLKSHGTLKDSDFNKYEAKMYISSQKQREMLGNLTNDVNFLSSEGLIDYSLIVYLVDKIKVLEPEESRTNSVEVEGGEIVINDLKSFRSYTEAIHISMVKTGSNEIGNPLVSIRSTKEALHYHVGIIDYLQKFTWKKRFEKSWKQLKAIDFSLDVSSQDPETYSWRFMRYMRQIILQQKVL